MVMRALRMDKFHQGHICICSEKKRDPNSIPEELPVGKEVGKGIN